MKYKHFIEVSNICPTITLNNYLLVQGYIISNTASFQNHVKILHSLHVINDISMWDADTTYVTIVLNAALKIDNFSEFRHSNVL